jgi:hypothetical protein
MMNKKAVLGGMFVFFFGVIIYFVILAAASPTISTLSTSTISQIDTNEYPFLTLVLYMMVPLVWFISLLAVGLFYMVMFGGGSSIGQ